jgi:serine/threonine protein phosphatase 1
MSVVAIGDIHGYLSALDNLLNKIASSLTESDTVVFLGDYIDGGPDSRGCVDRVLRFRSETEALVVTLMGNHEEWFLRSIDNHTKHSWILTMEGFSTVASYSEEVADLIRTELKRKATELVLEPTPLSYDRFLEVIPDSHMAFYRELAAYHRTGKYVLVHAGVSENYVAVEQEPERTLRWGCPSFPDCYVGDDTIVYGHTPTDSDDDLGRPAIRVHGNTIGIDTIQSGILTAVRLPEMDVIQSDAPG